MNKLTLAFVAAFALAGCAHHGAHTSASAEKECCAMKKGEAMKGGAECKHDMKSAEGKDACDHDKMADASACKHDMTTAEGKAACEHEKTEAAAVASPTPAAK